MRLLAYARSHKSEAALIALCVLCTAWAFCEGVRPIR